MIVRLVNINEGEDNPILNHCQLMREYAAFTGAVMRNLKKHTIPEEALTQAIDECIEKGILKDFLEKERARIMYSVLYEYDEEARLQMEREDAFEDGLNQRIEKYESILAEKDLILAEKDSVLAEKDSALAEKESALAKERALNAELMERLKNAGL